MPLKQFAHPFPENMRRIHGEMEKALYSAEIACHEHGPCTDETQKECWFSNCSPHSVCILKHLRSLLGDHPLLSINEVRLEDASPCKAPFFLEGFCINCGKHIQDHGEHNERCTTTETTAQQGQDESPNSDPARGKSNNGGDEMV